MNNIINKLNKMGYRIDRTDVNNEIVVLDKRDKIILTLSDASLWIAANFIFGGYYKSE